TFCLPAYVRQRPANFHPWPASRAIAFPARRESFPESGRARRPVWSRSSLNLSQSSGQSLAPATLFDLDLALLRQDRNLAMPLELAADVLITETGANKR